MVARQAETGFTTGIDQSANTPQSSVVAAGPARSGGEYFATPEPGPQRRYEALRAYLLDGERPGAVLGLDLASRGTRTSFSADFRGQVCSLIGASFVQ